MRKVIVLNPDVYEKLKERTNENENISTSKNKTIEHELEDILKSSKHPEEKRILYLQVLYKLLDAKPDVNMPLEIPIIEKTDIDDKKDIESKIKSEKLNITTTNNYGVGDNILNEILRIIPITRKKLGSKLYTFLKENPLLTWNKNGEIYIDDLKVENSSIITLVNDLLRMGKKDPVGGWFKILPKLRMMNIPHGIIQNRNRIKDIYGDDSPSHIAKGLDNRRRSIVSRGKKRKRENTKQRWEPY